VALGHACAEWLEELISVGPACHGSNASYWRLRTVFAPCLLVLGRVLRTPAYAAWRWRHCELHGAFGDMRGSFGRFHWPTATWEDLGLNHSVLAGSRIIAIDALKWRGCCDEHLVQEAEGLADRRPQSVRAMLLASSVLDCAGSHCQLRARRLQGEANTMQVRRVVSQRCRWALRPLRARAEVRHMSVAGPPVFAAPTVHGAVLLRGLRARFNDRSAELLYMRDVTLAWSAQVGSALVLDEERCETYASDHAPEDPHAVVFSAELIGTPYMQDWPCLGGDLGNAGQRRSHEVLTILSLAEVASNYYHFLTEFVAKLLWAQHIGWPSDLVGAAVPLLLTAEVATFTLVQEAVALLGIPTVTLPEASISYRCRLRALHVPAWSAVSYSDRPMDEVYLAPATQLLGLRAFFARADAEERSERVLVVTRADAGKRRFAGLADLISRVAPVEVFEAGSLEQQARVFSQHHVVVSPCGAALANIIFMPGNGAVVLLPCVPWNEHYHHITAVLASAGLLTRGLHVVASAAAVFAGDYHLSPVGCQDLLAAVTGLAGSQSRAASADIAASPCAGLAPPPPVQVCGLGPTGCLDWPGFEARIRHYVPPDRSQLD